jgi:methionyl-tRNA formyltransferase
LLIQKSAPVGIDDNAATIYFNTLAPLGLAALAEALPLIASGTPPRVAQNEADATYQPLISDSSAKVTWTDSSMAVRMHHGRFNSEDPQFN